MGMCFKHMWPTQNRCGRKNPVPYELVATRSFFTRAAYLRWCYSNCVALLHDASGTISMHGYGLVGNKDFWVGGFPSAPPPLPVG